MAAFDVAALSDSERAFFDALSKHGVRYLIVGMSAALLQGARGATEDINIWFETISHPGIGAAARDAGGFWVTRSEPPMLGGMSDRFDVVLSMSGLPDFESEYRASPEFRVDGVSLRVLPLSRIIESKRVANRAKDKAVLPALELADTLSRDLKT